MLMTVWVGHCIYIALSIVYNDMRDSVTTMLMIYKMAGINCIGIRTKTVYIHTPMCIADPKQNIMPKLSPVAQTDVQHKQTEPPYYS